MKKSFIISTLIFLGAFLLASCTKEIEGQSNNNSEVEKEINFVTGINNLSRTVINEGSLRTDFVNQDAIGIFVYEGENAVATNVKYVYDGNKWNPENGDALTSKTGVQYKYYAYYPYKEGLKDPKNISISINADQTEDLTINDFLSAQNTTAAAGADNISLSFSHAFSLVQVGIKDKVAVDVNEILMENVLPSSIIDITTGKTSATSGEAISVKMKKSTEKVEFRAIVPAQTITANNKLLTVKAADGKTYDVISKQNVSYIAGQALQITVNSLTPLPEGNEVTIGGSITDWDKGENPGEGEVSEIPLIQTINELPEVIADTRNFTEESWFKMVQSDTERKRSSFEIIEDNATAWGKAIKLTYNVNNEQINNSWYKATIGYNHTEPMYVTSNTSIYKVTAKVKAEVCDGASTVSTIMFTCKAKSSERYTYSFAASTKPDTFTATTVSKKPTNAGVWEEFIFYIDFNLLSSTIGSGIYGTDDKKFFVDATQEDYSGFDLRIYTNNANQKPVIYISDVKIEQYKNE